MFLILKYFKEINLSWLWGSLFSLLSLSAAFFEGLSMAMILPVLEFIEKGQDIGIIAKETGIWKIILFIFKSIKVPTTLFSLMSVVLVLIMFRIVFFYFRQIYTAWLAQEILHGTRTNLFNTILNSKYSYLDSLKTGQIVNLSTVEASRASGHIRSFFELMSNGFVLLGYIVLLLWVSVKMTILAITILIVASVIVSYFIRQTKRLSRLTTNANQDFLFKLIERLNAFRLIKITATEKREIKKTKIESENVRNHNFWLKKLNARVDLFLEPIVVLGGIIIIYAGVSIFLMTLSQVAIFILVLMRLLALSKEILKLRQSFMANAGGLEAVLSNLSEIKQKPELSGKGINFSGLKQGIEFKNVTFTYANQLKPALNMINLSIPAGKMTAFVGSSGAGKSTLADIIAGLRFPDKGTVLYDDIPQEKYDIKTIRRGIAFVSQDAFIFNDTAKNNISFAKLGKVKNKELMIAANEAMVTQFIECLPNSWETMLGERGTKLSGGQKQRISLARALLQKSPILLLDEATSALDSEVEKDIQNTISRLRISGKTTLIVIAHRLSTIREADQIIVLKDGKIHERGTHRELLVSEDWYSKICGIQNESEIVKNIS